MEKSPQTSPRLKANGIYSVYWKAGWPHHSIADHTPHVRQVLDSKTYGGLPQRRERLWIVGVKKAKAKRTLGDDMVEMKHQLVF